MASELDSIAKTMTATADNAIAMKNVACNMNPSNLWSVSCSLAERLVIYLGAEKVVHGQVIIHNAVTDGIGYAMCGYECIKQSHVIFLKNRPEKAHACSQFAVIFL